MIKDQFIERKKKEIRQLKRLRAHIPVLKVNVGLSSEKTRELEDMIDKRISDCEKSIQKTKSN